VAVIRDIMTTPAIALPSETTLAEAIRLLTKHHIGSAPVVDEDNVVIGVMSELALIDVVFDATLREAQVANYMTREVHAIGPDDGLPRAAMLFALYTFRRLPVVENGKLVGIVSRRDLMNYALTSNETLTEPLYELIPELAEIS